MKNSLKVVVYALVAAIFYGVVNDSIEMKLKDYSYVGTVFVLNLFCTFIGGFVLIVYWIMGHDVSVPLDRDIAGYAFLIALLYFVASILDVYAYTIGGKAVDISTIFIAIPVSAAVVKYATGRGLPNSYQIVAFIFVAIGVVILAKAPTTE